MNMRYSLLIFSHHRHRYNYPVLSSFMAHHRDCYTSNTTDDHPSGAPEFAPGFQQGSCYSIFSFMCNVLQIVVCPFVRFCLAIVVCPSQIYGFCLTLWYLQIFLKKQSTNQCNNVSRDRRGRDRMVVGFTAIGAVNAYHR